MIEFLLIHHLLSHELNCVELDRIESNRITGNVCALSGLIKSTNWSNLVAIVPADCRPQDGRLVFQVNHNEYTHRVDVTPKGEVIWVNGTQKYPWLSLDGILFTPSSSETLNLSAGFTPVGGDFRVPSFELQGELCILSGMLVGTNGTLLTVLPTSCRPMKQLIFGVPQLDSTQRIDVYPDGNLVWTSGPNSGWLSLDGIHFVTTPADDDLATKEQLAQNAQTAATKAAAELKTQQDLEAQLETNITSSKPPSRSS